MGRSLEISAKESLDTVTLFFDDVTGITIKAWEASTTPVELTLRTEDIPLLIEVLQKLTIKK